MKFNYILSAEPYSLAGSQGLRMKWPVEDSAFGNIAYFSIIDIPFP